MIVAMAWPFAASAQDCGCHQSCNSTYGRAQCSGGGLGACLAICENNAATGAAIGRVEDDLSKSAQTLLPAFRQARERLWKTDPKSSGFMDVYKAYRQLRIKRDNDLLMAYATVGLAGLFGGGAQYRALDDAYMMPASAAQAFHDYARAQMKAAVSVGPRLGGGGDKYAQMDEFGGGQRSYSGYAKLADEAELAVWSQAHGGPAVKVGGNGFPEVPGAPRVGIWGLPLVTDDPRFKACQARARNARREEIGRIMSDCRTSSDPALPPSTAVWPKVLN